MFSTTTKTLLKGTSKTRSRALPISIDKLILAKQAGFVDRVKQAVSDDEALEAARMLSDKSRARRYVESGALGATASPIIRAVGRGVEAAASRGSKLGLVGKALKNTNRGELARNVAEGALVGGGLQAAREGLELGRAKKTVKQFVEDRRQQLGFHTPAQSSAINGSEHLLKSAGVPPPSQSQSLPKRRPSDPWKYDSRTGEW